MEAFQQELQRGHSRREKSVPLLRKIHQIKAGPALDDLISNKITHGWFGSPSGDAFWPVVEKMIELTRGDRIRAFVGPVHKSPFTVLHTESELFPRGTECWYVWVHGPGTMAPVTGSTPGEATCRAALFALWLWKK